MGSQLGPAVYKSLQGIFCVYKPAGMSMSAMNSAFSLMLSNGKFMYVRQDLACLDKLCLWALTKLVKTG